MMMIILRSFGYLIKPVVVVDLKQQLNVGDIIFKIVMGIKVNNETTIRDDLIYNNLYTNKFIKMNSTQKIKKKYFQK